MFALDTNTLIYFFKGEGRVAERLLNTAPSEIAVPTVVIYELHVGLAKSTSPQRRRRQLDDMMEFVTLLSFDDKAAREAADIRATLEAIGNPVGPMDNLIAGTVRASGAVLVTRNTQEFSRIEGLRLDDWY